MSVADIAAGLTPDETRALLECVNPSDSFVVKPGALASICRKGLKLPGWGRVPTVLGRAVAAELANSNTPDTAVRDAYEDGECPDCGEPIAPDAEEGSECSNCGHVFWSEVKIDA